MRQMMAQYKRQGVQQIAILVAEGQSNIDPTRTIPEAEAAQRDNIDIFYVGALRLYL